MIFITQARLSLIGRREETLLAPIAAEGSEVCKLMMIVKAST